MTIRQFLTVLYARKWIVLATLVLVVGATAVVSALLPKRWTATAAVLIDAKGADPITGILLPAQMIPGYMATQVDIIESRNVALKVVNALKLHESPVARAEWAAATEERGSLQVWLADLLLRSLDARPARDSSLVSIAFAGSDPKFAAVVANAFAQAYIDTNLELKVEPARQTALWFSERTRSLRQEVEGTSAKLSQYQQQKGIVSLDERLDTENARLDQMNAQLSAAAAATADAMTRERLARDFVGRGGAPGTIPDVLSNALVQSLKSDLSRQEGKLQEAATQYGANHPQYQAATAEVQSVRQRLAEEMAGIVASLENGYRIAQRREAEMRAQVGAQRDRVLRLKKERDELSALMREAENAQKAFDVTTQRYTQTNLESQLTQTNIAVLNPAVEPLDPSFPRWFLYLALAGSVGLFLGVAAALLAEIVDQRLRSDDDVTAGLGVPLLATLPFARRGRGFAFRRGAPAA